MMKRALTSLALNPLFSGGLIMITAGGAANAASYIYHVVFGRIVGPSYYGELAALLSFVGIFISLFSALGTVVVKFSARGDNDRSLVYSWINKDLFAIISVVCLTIIAASPFIARSLKTDTIQILIIAPAILFSTLSLLYASILQGKLKFGHSALINVTTIVFRLIFGLLLFYLGLRLFGVIIGVLIASIITFLLAKYFVGRLELPTGIGKLDKQKIIKYALPIILASLSTGFMFAGDVILVKMYFSASIAGVYSSISILAKTIFYFSFPLVSVMFPLAAAKQDKGERTLGTLLFTFLIMGAVITAALVIFSIFSNQLVFLIFGLEYLPGAKYLTAMGVFASVFTISNLLSSYYFSLGFTKSSIFLILGAIAQTIGIYFFHSTISEVVSVLILTSTLLFISLFLYGLVKYIKE